MRSQRIEETTEANRVAAASAIARDRTLAAPDGRGVPHGAALLSELVELLAGTSSAARSAVLAQVCERLALGLGLERVAIYLPEAAPAPTGPAERFGLAACFAVPGARVGRAGEGEGGIADVIALSPDDEPGRRLLAGRPVRVLPPFALRGHPAATGALPAAGWSRVPATLQVPCPDPSGRPAALIALEGPSLPTVGARTFDGPIGAAAHLLAAWLERDRLAREVAALRAERARAERLAGLGRVASSAAHDLNNVLTVIVGHADLLELEWPGGAEPAPETPAAQALAEIRLAADRGARIVEELLAWGRKRPASSAPVDLAAAIGRLEGMLRRVAGDAIVLQLALEDALPPVFLDLERFERALVNLVVNARHAIEARAARPGRIELRLDRVRAAAGEDRVRLRVRDDGCGMDEALQRRVFEPFFTTRAAEGGTGLGLADVADFARASRATLALASAPGAGCEIELRFPPSPPLAH